MFSNDHNDAQLDLPKPLHNLNIKNRVTGGEITIAKLVTVYILESLLMLISGDMRSFFDPCINSIMGLIDSQIEQVNSLGRRLRV